MNKIKKTANVRNNFPIVTKQDVYFAVGCEIIISVQCLAIQIIFFSLFNMSYLEFSAVTKGV